MNHNTQQGNPEYRGNDKLCAVSVHPGLFTNAECQQVIGLREMLANEAGKAGLSSRVTAIRKSDVSWLPLEADTRWIYERIHGLVMQKNNMYRFVLAGFREPLQVASYSGEGHYGWHVDLGKQVTSTRKLSVSIQLSEEPDYTGGELEFWGMDDVRILKTAGAAVVFPSFLMHRVTPVTRGTRYSLVAWVHGPAFR